MSETTESTPISDGTPSSGGAAAVKKRGGGLNSMLIADLKAMAGGLGINGAAKMKKADLVAAIKGAGTPVKADKPKVEKQQVEKPPAEKQQVEKTVEEAPRVVRRTRGSSADPQDSSANAQEQADNAPVGNDQTKTAGSDERRDGGRGDDGESRGRTRSRNRNQTDQKQTDQKQTDGGQPEHKQNDSRQGQQELKQNQGDKGGNRNSSRNDNRDAQQSNQQNQGKQENHNDQHGDDQGSGRNRRRRGRDRDRTGRGNRNEPDTTILDDDVLVPAAGILDVLDNYAFVRTSGYLPGDDDVYVSLSMVRKFGLRRGDAIVGQVRQPREGERKEKFNPMVQIDAVNGADPDSAEERVEFSKLTPLYPTERLRLETTPTNLVGRAIDIAAPVGKGQRGLIVSPAKAGKTMVLQSIANSITVNNPECHLMVVLVDERPEEVTDFERSVKGEVISSTFDRPASDHTAVAELAIERAKRLVELGHDVVVLLDGITRLGRAYTMATPASGRLLAGGVDSAALYPPKKFFGAARNIENGGSLTILATALIESGSKMDEVIFEEFRDTANMEIRLRREFADKRIFPAIDAVQSGTRREELLMSEDELAIVWKLRRVLSGLEDQQAVELLLERLRKSQNNIDFLTQVQKNTPTAGARA